MTFPARNYTGQYIGPCASCGTSVYHASGCLVVEDNAYCSQMCYRDAMWRRSAANLLRSTTLTIVLTLACVAVASYIFLSATPK